MAVRLRRLAIGAGLLGAACLGAFYVLTIPERPDTARLAAVGAGDAARGRAVFYAGGCASCHAASQATGEARLSLGGGLELVTDFGTFVVPNISPHERDGIGGWSSDDFASAMLAGVSPASRHYYPAFPYGSYVRITPQDVGDLFAFIRTLPPVEGVAAPHRLAFPFNLRRGVGLWKLANLDDEPILALPADTDPRVERGRYLVEGPGHCGECHTPRTATQGLDMSRWLAGAPAAEGDGTIPNITPSEDGIGDWSEDDIAYYLESGFTPDFDSAGGPMAAVVRSLAELPAEDRAAIAAYLKAIPVH